MKVEEKDLKRLSGTVKWFDSAKGFGFMVSEQMEGVDILLHVNVLRNFGQGSVVDGTGVEATVLVTTRGAQVNEILALTPPHSPTVPLAEICGLSVSDIEQLPLLPARVKWFSPRKGYGFANIFGDATDIFVHAEVLMHCGFATLTGGEAVAIRVVDGKRGKMAVRVLAWDGAHTKPATVTEAKAAIAAK